MVLVLKRSSRRCHGERQWHTKKNRLSHPVLLIDGLSGVFAGGGEGWIQLMTALVNQQLDQCVAIP